MLKKILFLFVFIAFLNFESYAQCAVITNNACTLNAPTVIGNSITCTPPANDGGRRNFRVDNMIANATYRISNCGSGFDTQMTIRDLGGASVGYNDDDGPACIGTASSIDFVPATDASYRIQMNRYNCATTDALVGDIVVTLISNAPAAPSNDDCSSATSIGVSTGTTCTTNTTGNTIGATQSLTGCSGNADDDVWYSFVATNNVHNITANAGTIYDLVLEAFSGSCGTLTSINCEDFNDPFFFDPDEEIMTLSGLTIGNTYYARVSSWGGNGDEGTFDICITTPVDPCSTITTISCDTPVNAVIAAGGGSFNTNPCGTWGLSGNELLYSFTPTVSGNHSITQISTAGSGNLHGNYLYKESSLGCDASNWNCLGHLVNSAETSTGVNLIAGTTYYILLDTEDSAANNITFQINCATIPPSCGGNFYDSGGVAGNYSNDELTTTTLTPDIPGTAITAAFTFFNTEANYDELRIYDGPDATYPLLGTYDGIALPPTWTSSDPSGALTFVFESDFSNTEGGWAADITCISNCNLMIVDVNFPPLSDDCSLDYTELTTNATPTFTQTNVYTETFNGGTFPSGWTIINGAASADWNISNSNNAGGTANEAHLEWTGGSHVNNWSISSPAIDITGQTNLQLSFRHYLNIFSTGLSIYLETSLDGTAWTTQYSALNIANDIAAANQNVDISSLDGNTTMYIRYRLNGDTFNFLDWYIDDILITANGSSTPPQITWTPITGLYTDVNLSIPYVASTSAETVYAAPDGTETYTAEDINGCTDMVTVINNKKTWNGTPGNTDWATATNWTPNGIPTITDCIVIPDTGGNNPVINGTTNGLGYRLIIESGADLTLDDDTTDANYASLTIENDITLENNSLLHIQNNSSLVQINESVVNVNNNTGTGTLIMDRAPFVSNTDYVYWSSPVSNMSLSNIYGIDTPNATYQWRPTIPNGTYTLPPGPCTPNVIPFCHGDWETYSGNMDIGKGYISSGPTSQGTTPSNYPTSIYGSLPNNGIITHIIESGTNLSTNCDFTHSVNGNPITVTPFDDNWNLIGNPYPSAISANAFIGYSASGVDNSSIEGAIHIWTHGTDANGGNPDPFYDDYVLNYNPNDYLTYNLTGTNIYPNEIVASDYFIGAGQGFFVLADFDNGTNNVTFSNTMRDITHDNSSFYRSSNNVNTETTTIERHRIWLNLSNESEQTSNTMVGYIEGASQAKDRIFDAYTFESNTMSIYSMIEDERMVIQGRQLPFNSNDQVPLGLNIIEEGNYTISISGVDGLFEGNNPQDIYLEDIYEDVTHNLRYSPYTFSSNIGSIYDRFILRYTTNKLSVNDFDTLSGIKVFEENEKIVIKSDHENIQSIEVYDILGRTLFLDKSVNLNQFTINALQPKDAVIFLKIKLVDGKQKIAKIIF